MKTSLAPRFLLRAALGVAIAVFAAVATAQAAGSERVEKLRTELHKRFAAADTNTDGRLTRDEAKSKMPWVYKNFDAIDAAQAGTVTMGDIEAYAASRRGGRQSAK